MKVVATKSFSHGVSGRGSKPMYFKEGQTYEWETYTKWSPVEKEIKFLADKTPLLKWLRTTYPKPEQIRQQKELEESREKAQEILRKRSEEKLPEQEAKELQEKAKKARKKAREDKSTKNTAKEQGKPQEEA